MLRLHRSSQHGSIAQSEKGRHAAREKASKKTTQQKEGNWVNIAKKVPKEAFDSCSPFDWFVSFFALG